MKRREIDRETERTFTWNEVLDVLDLVLESKWPDGHYGDDECNLWSAMHDEFDAHGMSKRKW